MPSRTTSFSPIQIDILAARAISPEVALAAGVRAVHTVADLPPEAPDYWTEAEGYLPGLLFTYRGPDGAEELQLRPDVPVVTEDEDGGKAVTRKYVFAKGARSVIHCARPIETTNVLLMEGTCQAIATAHYAPAGWAVYGIAGCQSWMSAGVPASGLEVVDGRRVFVALDADAETNRAVYDAGVKLARALEMNGAREVRFIRSAGGQKAGLDDVLAGAPEHRRTRLLEGLVAGTEALKPADKPSVPARRRPDAKKADRDGSESPWFDVDGGLLVERLAGAIRDDHACLLARDDTVAVYRDGVYILDGLAIRSAVTDRLGDLFRIGHRANVEEFLVAELARLGERLPEYQDRPLVNFRNGMLDLENGQLLPHSPKFGSTHQLTVDWDPDAVAPVFGAWALESAGAQVDVLLEAASAVLDPSASPAKALFLFGPARSGKSTFLRLLEALVGPEFVGGVSLHQLADDQFAAANLYGKRLNVDADVRAADVRDLSLFKRLTGEDVITANRKYGHQFEFRNRALFAFSANELPSVGENSRAYVARMLPVLFGRSFEGREDATLEARLRAELPGIAVLLVRAWQARRARGAGLVSHPAVVALFEQASDRVRQWFDDRAERTEGDALGMTVSELHREFKRWAQDVGALDLGRKAFAGRLAMVPGLTEVREGGTGKRGWNVRIRPENTWNDGSVLDLYQEVMGQVREGVAVVAVPVPTVTPSPARDIKTGDFGQRSQIPMVSSSGNSRPETATTATTPEPRESVILKGIKALAPSEMPRCRVCGASEVLVDGHWFACPVCHPATARVHGE